MEEQHLVEINHVVEGVSFVELQINQVYPGNLYPSLSALGRGRVQSSHDKKRCSRHSVWGCPIHTCKPWKFKFCNCIALPHSTYASLTHHYFVQEAVFIANAVQHLHSKFLFVRPILWSQCMHCLDLVCMQF